jgi:hypothetical protein
MMHGYNLLNQQKKLICLFFSLVLDYTTLTDITKVEMI